ncbi:MAG TPA: hypothetical protein V6C57_17355, partial [Coleofasciculaceae cyanobacterium]
MTESFSFSPTSSSRSHASRLKKLLVRGLSLILMICLTFLWIMLDARPAIAAIDTVNYNNANLNNQDFS